MKALIAAVLATLPALPATALTIDFDALDSSSAQPVPLKSFTENDYTFALTYSPPNASLGPVIFDTTCTGYGDPDGCNGDIDLVPGIANLSGGIQGQNGISGNVLALQESRPGAPTPNDDASAGAITLTVVSGKAFRLLGFSAVDDGQYTASTSVDGVLGTIDNGTGKAFNNVTGAISFRSSKLGVNDSITIALTSSGGIDSLILAPVPVPAAAPLLVAGLGLLAWAGRRRNGA